MPINMNSKTSNLYDYGGSNNFTTRQREISLWSAVRTLRLTTSNVSQIIVAIKRNT